MVFITLAIAGAVLAHQKIEKRKEARSLAQEQAQRLLREEEAFAELQTYANFQDSLSLKVLDDIETESLHSRADSYRNSNSIFDFDFNRTENAEQGKGLSGNDRQGAKGKGPPRYSYAMRGYEVPLLLSSIEDDASDVKMSGYEPSISSLTDARGSIDLPSTYGTTEKAQLSSPIVLRQERDSTGTQGWGRAYLPSLLYCGISQSSFLDFIDSFNAYLQTSPSLLAINIASLTEFLVTTTSQSLNAIINTDPIATLLPALEIAKQIPSSQQNPFLDLANDVLFTPNGLFAVVISSHPSSTEHVVSVDFKQSHNKIQKVDAALSLLALNTTSPEPGARSSYASSRNNRASAGSDLGHRHRSRPISQPDNYPTQNNPFEDQVSSPGSIHAFVNSVSTAHDRRKHSRRLKKRHTTVLGTGLGMGLGNSSGNSVRVDKGRPASVSSFSSGLSGRMGFMALGSGSGVRDSMTSVESWRRAEEYGPDFDLQPGALYLVIINDPSRHRS